MSEREPQDTGPRSKFDRTTSIAVSAVAGGSMGGIGYGITRVISGGDLAEKVGIGLGGTFGPLCAGMLLTIDSNKRAEEYAIRGKMGRAALKILQSGAEGSLGCGTAGVISGYESAREKGAIIGGLIGAFLGLSSALSISQDIRHVGKAYREAIIPARNPRNFPGLRVMNHEGFNNDDLLSELPPVYRAHTFEDMKQFREEQAKQIVAKATEMSGIFKNPTYLLTRIDQAIFVIPEVVHHLSSDSNSQFDESIELIDIEGGTLNLQPYKESSDSVWISPTIFDKNAVDGFSEERWQACKDGNWKHGAVVFVKRNISYPAEGSTSSSFKIEEQYYLLDLLIGGAFRGKRRTRRKEEEVRALVPALEPDSLIPF